MAAKTMTPIKKVLATMVTAPTIEGDPQARIREINETIDKTRKLNGNGFFAFESFSEQMTETIRDLQNQKLDLTLAVMGYAEIDYTFLSWRKTGTKMPAFMVLSLESNRFEISVEPYNVRDEQEGKVNFDHTEWSVDPDLPEPMRLQFADSAKYLAELSAKKYGWNQIEVSTEFRGGIMPASLREKIVSAQKAKIFNEIFVIAEATDWEIDEIVRVKGDPLVVGWVESSEKMYLIGSYDPTPLEVYILEQMTK